MRGGWKGTDSHYQGLTYPIPGSKGPAAVTPGGVGLWDSAWGGMMTAVRNPAEPLGPGHFTHTPTLAFMDLLNTTLQKVTHPKAPESQNTQCDPMGPFCTLGRLLGGVTLGRGGTFGEQRGTQRVAPSFCGWGWEWAHTCGIWGWLSCMERKSPLVVLCVS